jgi:hypothetical protein
MSLAHATRSTRRNRTSYLASGLLLLATVVGGVRATALLTADESSESLTFAGATWTVTDVTQVVGVAQRDLMSGMGHNISGYVSDSQMMVTVSFVVSAGDQRAGFDPTQLRAYEVGKKTPIPSNGGSLGTGVLSAHGQVEGTVTFVVPRDGEHLVLRAQGAPGDIDLTTVDQAPSGAGSDDHQHHEH